MAGKLTGKKTKSGKKKISARNLGGVVGGAKKTTRKKAGGGGKKTRKKL
ncbi:MAG: hypothetical protein ACYTE6_02260 [Planctomycetota bacterium]